jgi:hypothetical protein
VLELTVLFQSHGRRNQNGLEERWKQAQLLDGSEGDQRAGIRDDGQSEGLTILNLSAEFLTAQLQVRDASL